MVPLTALGRFDRELAWAVYLMNAGKTPMAPRVGFAGIQGYVDKAQAELDTRADQFADRVDTVKGRGLGTLDAHHKRLDSVEAQIDHMDAMVREGSNGGPLPDAAPQQAPQGSAEQSTNTALHDGVHPSLRAQNAQ